MVKSIIVALMAAVLLTGCASDSNRQALADDERRCATGDKVFCELAVQQERINHDEAMSNGLKAAAIGVLLPLAIIAAAAAERDDYYPPPARCWSYRWQRWYYC